MKCCECEDDGCCERSATHCWFLWCCICSIVTTSLPRVSCIPDPIVTLFLWCFAGSNSPNNDWFKDQFTASSFGATGVDVMVLSLIRCSVQYYMFEYNRSKTFQSLFVSTTMFSFSSGYLFIKIMYSVVADDTSALPMSVWGLVIGIIQISFYLAFRRKRIRGRRARKKFHQKLDSESESDYGIEIGSGPLAETKKVDLMAYVETPLSLKKDAGIPPEALKDEDSLFMDVLDVRLHYKMWESERKSEAEDRDTTVLLHGFGGSCFCWREVWEPLKDTTQCLIAIDMPGSGLTSRPLEQRENVYGGKYACALLFEVLDKFGIKKCNLVGHGMGGSLAVFAAITHPTRVRRITLISPMTFMDPFPKFIRDLFRTSIGKEMVVALVRSQIGEMVLRKAWYNKKRIPEVALRRYENVVKLRNWHSALIELSRAESLKITRKHLSQGLSCPVGIIHGENDQIVPVSNSVRLQADLSNTGSATLLHRIPRCGHVPHEELPDEFMHAYKQVIAHLNTRSSAEYKDTKLEDDDYHPGSRVV